MHGGVIKCTLHGQQHMHTFLFKLRFYILHHVRFAVTFCVKRELIISKK